MGGALIYVIYGFVSGFVSHYASFPPLAQQIILHKFHLALKVLAVGFCLLLTALVLRYLLSFEFAFLLLLSGLFLYFLVPLIFGAFYPGQGFTNLPLARVLYTTRLMGEISIVLAGLLFILGIGSLLHKRLAVRVFVREKETPPPAHPSIPFLHRLLKPCWTTPYCRDFLIEFCPAYTKKTTCWKAGGGCLCDEAIVNRLLAQTSVRKPEKISSLKGTSQLMQRHELDCSKCPIYAEHQRQKYQLIAPFIPITIIAIFWFARAGIHNYYMSVAKFFDNLFSNLAYLPTTSGKVLSTLATPWLETTILVILALLLVGLLLHLLDYLVYSLGW